MTSETKYMLDRTGYLTLIFLFHLFGCRITKIKPSCLSGVNENSSTSVKKILHQIDSVYSLKPDTHLKEVIGSKCISDTLIEVKVQNTQFIYDLFYFNNNIRLIKIRHELEPLH